MSSSKMQPVSDKIVKVAIKVYNEALLFKLDQDKLLEDVLQDICTHCKISYEADKYALQLLLPDSNQEEYMYITENNRHKIKNGNELKFTCGPHILAKKIKEKLKSKTEEHYSQALKQAATCTTDFIFCKEFVRVGYLELQTLLKHLVSTNDLSIDALDIVLNLIRSSYLKSLDKDFILGLKDVITSDHTVNYGIIERSFKIMEELVLMKGDSEIITKLLKLDDFIHHIWNRNSTSIQGNMLALINAIVLKCLIAKTQHSILQQMNSRDFKDKIYSNVILSNTVQYNSTVPSTLANALNIYQSLILTLAKERYNNKIKIESLLPRLVPCLQSEKIIDNNAKSEIEAELFGLSKDSENMLTMDVSNNRNKFSSNLSITSSILVGSDDEEQEIDDVVFTPEEPTKENVLSHLTFECVLYLYNNHREVFKIALFDDGNNYTKFLNTCGRVVSMICVKVLHIGDIPEHGEASYCPLIFFSAVPFLEELFSKAMNILQKNKREMRAKSAGDLDKVFQVLQQQLVKALKCQPITYDQLETVLGELSYQAVRSQWEVEQEQRERHTLTNSPAINQLKQSLVAEAKELVKKQRLECIKSETKFPAWSSHKNERVRNKTWSAFLSNDEKVIYYCVDEGELKQLPVQSITGLLTGRNCPHIKYLKSKDSKASKKELAFSLVTDEQSTLDFIADTQEIYDQWTDAINVLQGVEMRSTSMKRDLNDLLEMELKLCLLDVDGIDLPLDAPPVPLDPPNYDFYYLRNEKRQI